MARKENRDETLWTYASKSLVSMMNYGQLDCKNLATVMWDLHLIKLKSPKLYDYFIVYFNK